MITVNEKPMSVNDSYMGTKRKSKEYRVYETNVSAQLPDLFIPDGKLILYMKVYFSNSRADLDNSIKPFLDILQARYSFNDCRIYEIHIEKFVVPKGEEKIEFMIEGLE